MIAYDIQPYKSQQKKNNNPQTRQKTWNCKSILWENYYIIKLFALGCVKDFSYTKTVHPHYFECEKVQHEYGGKSPAF